MHQVFIGNLDYDATEEQIRELFAPYGELLSIKIIPRRGFGFVELASAEQAESAKAGLTGVTFLGREIAVRDAVKGKTSAE